MLRLVNLKTLKTNNKGQRAHHMYTFKTRWKLSFCYSAWCSPIGPAGALTSAGLWGLQSFLPPGGVDGSAERARGELQRGARVDGVCLFGGGASGGVSTRQCEFDSSSEMRNTQHLLNIYSRHVCFNPVSVCSGTFGTFAFKAAAGQMQICAIYNHHFIIFI